MKPTQEQVIAWAREAGFDWSGKELSWEEVICTDELRIALTLAYEAGRKDKNEACEGKPQREWRGLTGAERKVLWQAANTNTQFGELIEAKLRQLNT